MMGRICFPPAASDAPSDGSKWTGSAPASVCSHAFWAAVAAGADLIPRAAAGSPCLRVAGWGSCSPSRPSLLTSCGDESQVAACVRAINQLARERSSWPQSPAAPFAARSVRTSSFAPWMQCPAPRRTPQSARLPITQRPPRNKSRLRPPAR